MTHRFKLPAYVQELGKPTIEISDVITLCDACSEMQIAHVLGLCESCEAAFYGKLMHQDLFEDD